MKWFKHHTKALTDPKIEKLIMRFGIEGYGLYFACLEIIAGNLTGDNITFELEHDAEIIAYKFKIDTLKVESIIKYCVELGLFEYNTISKRIQCIKLLDYIDDSSSKNPEIKKIVNQAKTGEFGKIQNNSGIIQKNSESLRPDYITLDYITEDKKKESQECDKAEALNHHQGSDRKTNLESLLGFEEEDSAPRDPEQKKRADNWYKKRDNGKAAAYIKNQVKKTVEHYVFTPYENGIIKNIVNNLRTTDEDGNDVFDAYYFYDKWEAYADDKFWLDKGAKNLSSFYKNMSRIPV